MGTRIRTIGLWPQEKEGVPCFWKLGGPIFVAIDSEASKLILIKPIKHASTIELNEH